MIDHVSIGVSDLDSSAAFYDAVLATIGYSKLVVRSNTVGFGKHYPEFWLNLRAGKAPTGADSGMHVCLRAPDSAAVDAFYKAALGAGATSEGIPGLRPDYSPTYYAAFICDADGNKIEAVTFQNSGKP